MTKRKTQNYFQREIVLKENFTVFTCSAFQSYNQKKSKLFSDHMTFALFSFEMQ